MSVFNQQQISEIKADVVINYKDAILELTSNGAYKKGSCNYYACIIMSGEPYRELSYYNDIHIYLGNLLRL